MPLILDGYFHDLKRNMVIAHLRIGTPDGQQTPMGVDQSVVEAIAAANGREVWTEEDVAQACSAWDTCTVAPLAPPPEPVAPPPLYPAMMPPPVAEADEPQG